jgi:hypothetical protein
LNKYLLPTLSTTASRSETYIKEDKSVIFCA